MVRLIDLDGPGVARLVRVTGDARDVPVDRQILVVEENLPEQRDLSVSVARRRRLRLGDGGGEGGIDLVANVYDNPNPERAPRRCRPAASRAAAACGRSADARPERPSGVRGENHCGKQRW